MLSYQDKGHIGRSHWAKTVPLQESDHGSWPRPEAMTEFDFIQTPCALLDSPQLPSAACELYNPNVVPSHALNAWTGDSCEQNRRQTQNSVRCTAAAPLCAVYGHAPSAWVTYEREARINGGPAGTYSDSSQPSSSSSGSSSASQSSEQMQFPARGAHFGSTYSLFSMQQSTQQLT